MAFPARAVAILAAALLGASQEAPWKLEPPAPAVALKPAELADVSGENCGDCHAAVLDEWRDTAHAVAWLDEVYQEELVDRKRPESCHGCHIPKPLLAEGSLARRAEPRADAKHLGISCGSCHAGPGGTILGARGTKTDAHPTAASEHLAEKTSSTMCATCHSTNIGPVVGIAKDFFTAKMEDRGRSCVGCHMAPVEREPSKGAAEGAAKVAGRSHAIQTPRDPRFLALAFAASAKPEGKGFVVAIRNQAGHRVPGLIGRTIEFRAELLDASGKPVAEKTLELDARSYLAVDGEAKIALEGAGAAVRLRGVHHDPRQEEPVEFLDVKLSPDGR